MKKTCAIYTRKSTEERLDMEFNTLDAQREACEAYILSQRSEGWVASPEEYDDGGFSGGTLERPALARLLDDIRAGKIQTVVVYKIDRLTRSLMDFAKLVEVFDAQGVTFVSVTQSFNTTTSMGRLTLNVLLSFAQFEREVAGERIRDKIAASKARGMWMGGVPPVGYSLENRQLVVNPAEVPLANKIFERYAALGSVQALKRELDGAGVISPARLSLKGLPYGGRSFSRGGLYVILRNPAYIGKISHKGKIHEGLHEGIIEPGLWTRVQTMLENNTVSRTDITQQRHMLQGLLFDTDGVPYSPTFTKRHDRQYRYYISQNLLQYRDHPNGLMARLPAHEIETLVETALRKEIPKLCGEEEGPVRDHVLKHQDAIPAYDLIRACAAKITVGLDRIVVAINPKLFSKLIDQYFNLSLNQQCSAYDITVPFLNARGKKGSVIIRHSDTKKDIFDLPPSDLKKLVQGVIWRDEHFGGKALKDIAKRERCSEAYVGTAVFGTFQMCSF